MGEAWRFQNLIEAINTYKNYPIKVAINKLFKWGALAAFALLVSTIIALIFTNSGLYEVYDS